MVENDSVFVNIAIKEGADDIIELPCERDGTLLLSTLQSQFENAIGLKYRSSSGGWRGVKVEDNVLEPPSGGWDEKVYIITESVALKRKTSNSSSGYDRRLRKSSKLLEDLIVLGIPFSTTEEELHQYINEHCGELSYCELKLDHHTKKSRGFGFIRFKDEESAQKAFEEHLEIEGRKLEIRLSRKKDEVPMKLFIGRLNNGTTREDISDYFSDFGDLYDAFLPNNPFRGIAFVTFCDQEDAQKVLRLNHSLKGAKLRVTPALPKEGVSSKRPENIGVINMERGQDRNDFFAKVDNNSSRSYGASNTSSTSYNRQNQQQQYPEKDVASDITDMLMQLLNSRK